MGKTGLEYGRQVGVAYLQNKFGAGLHLPDQSGEASAPVIGGITWELKNIALSGINLPASSIVINPGSGLTVSMY